jgi:hypothetical protein
MRMPSSTPLQRSCSSTILSLIEFGRLVWLGMMQLCTATPLAKNAVLLGTDRSYTGRSPASRTPTTGSDIVGIVAADAGITCDLASNHDSQPIDAKKSALAMHFIEKLSSRTAVRRWRVMLSCRR